MKQRQQIVTLLITVLLAGSAGFLSSCKKEIPPPNVTEWVTHQDPINGMEIKYPSGWILNADPKSKKIYSTQEVAGKFYEVYSTGTTEVGEDEGGVEMTMAIETFKEANAGTLDDFKKITLETYAPYNLGDEQPVTIGKEQGISFSYSVKVGKNTTLSGKKMIIAHDSSFYTVSITGFNDYFPVYSSVLEEIVASIKLPRPKETFKDPNAASLPSMEKSTFANDFVEFMYPDNFTVTPVSGNKGGAINTLHVEGLRKDCTIDIDVFPMKTDKGEVKFDRFFEDNKSKFSPKSTKDVKVDGMDAKMITASPAAQIDRRVYFVAKGERIFRVILTWYRPMGKDFEPAFESVVASMKLK